MEPSQFSGGEGSHGQFPAANMNAYQPRFRPSQSNVGEGSEGQFAAGNMNAYQAAGWNPYMYPMMNPTGYIPMMNPRGFVPMMNPSGYVPGGSQPAQMEEPTVDHCRANLDEVAPVSAQTRKKKAGSRTKLGNFNPDEDKYLVKSWLEVSCDPITSNGQRRDRMWERIMNRYNLKRPPNPERTLRSLQSRWDTIKTECGHFASYYARTIRENPSGMSDADKTTHAATKYADCEKHTFGFLHCWDLLKDEPKWQDPNARDNATAARGEGFHQSSAPSDTVDLVDGECSQQPSETLGSPVPSGAQPRRPMGRDAAKAAKKKANSDAASASSAEYAAKMQDLSLQRISVFQEDCQRRNDRLQALVTIEDKRFEEMQRNNEKMAKIEEDKLQFLREQHEDKKRKEEKQEDERILAIDLAACTPALRQYYQILQEEILEKQAARRRNRNVS